MIPLERSKIYTMEIIPLKNPENRKIDPGRSPKEIGRLKQDKKFKSKKGGRR